MADLRVKVSKVRIQRIRSPLEMLSTPGPESQFEEWKFSDFKWYRDLSEKHEEADCWPAALEAERNAEKAEQAERARKARRLRLAKPVLSPMQFSVFQLKLAGLEDSEVATALGITKNAVESYRYEYRKALSSGRPYRNRRSSKSRDETPPS